MCPAASSPPTIQALAGQLGELQKGRARVQQQLDALPGMARWQNVEVKDSRQPKSMPTERLCRVCSSLTALSASGSAKWQALAIDRCMCSMSHTARGWNSGHNTSGHRIEKRAAMPACTKRPPGQQLAALVVPLHCFGAAALQCVCNVCMEGEAITGGSLKCTRLSIQGSSLERRQVAAAKAGQAHLHPAARSGHPSAPDCA